METSNEVLNRFGERFVSAIKTALQTKDMTGYGPSVATGDLLNSIRYEVNGNSLTIFGKQYIGALENGRKPTENTGDGTLREKIRRWIDVKGIEPDDISKDSLAYLIARKIHEEGTTIYRKYAGGSSGLLSDAINEDEIESLQDALIFAYVETVKSSVLKKVPQANREMA